MWGLVRNRISAFSSATGVLLPIVVPTTPDGSVRGGLNGGDDERRLELEPRPQSGRPSPSRGWDWAVLRLVPAPGACGGLLDGDGLLARAQPPGDVRRRHRPGVQVALDLVDPERAEQVVLLHLLDALRDDAEAQRVGDVNDGTYDGSVGRAPRDAGDERLVDLDLVDRQALEVGQRGVAGPEVVDGDLDPESV